MSVLRELSVLRSSNPKLHAEPKMSLTALHQILKNATTKNSSFDMRNSYMMKTINLIHFAEVIGF